MELDLDAIQNIPSSAKTSSGISTIEARKYIHEVASACKVAYFHIAEAAPLLSHIKTDLKGILKHLVKIINCPINLSSFGERFIIVLQGIHDFHSVIISGLFCKIASIRSFTEGVKSGTTSSEVKVSRNCSGFDAPKITVETY